MKHIPEKVAADFWGWLRKMYPSYTAQNENTDYVTFAWRGSTQEYSVNFLLGSALATIGLTLPAILVISLYTSQSVMLGLSPAFNVLLVLTLVMSIMTFGGTRTNMLQGAVHLVIFLTYLMLIFSP